MPLEKEKGLQQKELEKSTHEAAEVESGEKQDTDVKMVGGEDEENIKGDQKDENEGQKDEDKSAAKDEAGKKPGLVQFVMWSQEEVDFEHSESSDFNVEDGKSQMGFSGEEANEKAVEETEMQLEEDVGAKTDIRALFDSDSESDSDL